MNTISAIRHASFNVSAKTNWFFVIVETTDGRRAAGEASLNGWESALAACTAQQALALTGLDVHAALARVRCAPQSPGGLVVNAVISALDQALVSLAAEAAGQPLAVWLGGVQRSHVPAYANINRATLDRSPAGFAASVRAAQARGFHAFKLAPFDGVTPANCASTEGARLIAAGIERIQSVRDAAGREARVMADCHWRFDEARALDTLRALRDVDLFWFECPVAEEHAYWPALRRIRSAANGMGVRIAAAETQIGDATFKELFAAGLYDVVMPDVKYCGGVREMLAISQSAARAGVAFAPHNPTGPVCTVASLHVAAAAPECLMLELQVGESPLYDALVSARHPPVRDGGFDVPDTPGLGVEIDTALLARHPHRDVPFGIETQIAHGMF